MSKLGLLKDSDFKVMHDRKLPVHGGDIAEVQRFISTIEADVNFLEGLRIMDYSLFLIVLEMPESFYLANAEPEDIKISCEQIELNNGGHNNSESTNKYTVVSIDDPERRQLEKDFLDRLEELAKLGRFVMYSPSKRFCYIMGLIDYLGKWNMNKRLEMFGKRVRAHFIRQNTDFSVKPPDEFARRFKKKVRRIFRVPKEDIQKHQIDPTVCNVVTGSMYVPIPKLLSAGLSNGGSDYAAGHIARSFEKSPKQPAIQELEEEHKKNHYDSPKNESSDDEGEEGSYHPKWE